ncbi:MAG: hypothetical protein R2690_21250 [Acidimicrobiales bacterium]
MLAFAVPWRMLLGIAVGTALTADGARNVVRWESIRLVLLGLVVAIAASLSGSSPWRRRRRRSASWPSASSCSAPPHTRPACQSNPARAVGDRAIVGSLATAIVLGRACGAPAGRRSTLEDGNR